MEQNTFDVTCEGSLILKDMEIRGSISSEKDICLKGAIQGDIRCNAKVMMFSHSVIDGDVSCENLFMDGMISGDVHVANRAVLDEHAVVNGHLIAGGLTIHPDAVINAGFGFEGKK